LKDRVSHADNWVVEFPEYRFKVSAESWSGKLDMNYDGRFLLHIGCREKRAIHKNGEFIIAFVGFDLSEIRNSLTNISLIRLPQIVVVQAVDQPRHREGNTLDLLS